MRTSVVIAPDSFKGSCTAVQVAQAVADGVLSVCPDCRVRKMPLADGGEGTAQLLVEACGGRWVTMEAHDPLMRVRQCRYGILPEGNTAVVEVAETCGFMLLQPHERNLLRATSYGVGEQICHAYAQGCRRFIVGLGGSAVCDAGEGMLQAFGDALLTGLASADFVVLCDVDNPLYGERGAAFVFAPQKGASPEQVRLLDERLRRLAAGYGEVEAAMRGAGAAGGLGYAFAAVLKARLQSGTQAVLDMLKFDDYLHDADLIITGEGCIDRQTIAGKLPMGVMSRARKHNVPVIALAGKVKEREELLAAGFSDVICINPYGVDETLATDTAYALSRLRITAAEVMRNRSPYMKSCIMP